MLPVIGARALIAGCLFFNPDGHIPPALFFLPSVNIDKPVIRRLSLKALPQGMQNVISRPGHGEVRNL